MKAVVCTKYGPPEVLHIEEVETPAPKPDEVRIKIHATVVTSSDWFIRRGFVDFSVVFMILGRLLIGLTRPRKLILGLVLAGEVETLGKDVRRFRAGDAIFAFTQMRFGAYAEYTCLPENSVMALKPSNLTYEERPPLFPTGVYWPCHSCGGERSTAVRGSSCTGLPGLSAPRPYSSPGPLEPR